MTKRKSEAPRETKICGAGADITFLRKHVPRVVRPVYDRAAAARLWPAFLAGDITRGQLMEMIGGKDG
jgi:hypothetical protein